MVFELYMLIFIAAVVVVSVPIGYLVAKFDKKHNLNKEQ